ncbi:hypothetical protein QE441_003658 [Chryseobacterium sp. SORGH_AS909]|uniref:Transposase n=1 Tax=Chryseobacterium camelliae TaxID=1265445 RepID=A0ABU0THQ0_9FLAO|nr:hypothetical protein [Chryseobacterium camelliae]MDQ1100524.1 hypothetical protein [Chryseobacterium sp. SORGH_AS_1048]MDR6087864.1 hypothetical protein [Chryseobacterium sp. SORGH_AS_0909]MDR6132240.1 hypothetical protein [Chryseobacterium sp. SORGH_AS_1175]MDT3409555.1 hypothetical protein [Pseudacidovorax intermedius]
MTKCKNEHTGKPFGRMAFYFAGIEIENRLQLLLKNI